MTQLVCHTTCVCVSAALRERDDSLQCAYSQVDARTLSRRAHGCLCCCLAGSCTTGSFSRLSYCATSGRLCQHQCRMITGVMDARAGFWAVSLDPESQGRLLSRQTQPCCAVGAPLGTSAGLSHAATVAAQQPVPSTIRAVSAMLLRFHNSPATCRASKLLWPGRRRNARTFSGRAPF